MSARQLGCQSTVRLGWKRAWTGSPLTAELFATNRLREGGNCLQWLHPQMTQPGSNGYFKWSQMAQIKLNGSQNEPEKETTVYICRSKGINRERLQKNK